MTDEEERKEDTTPEVEGADQAGEDVGEPEGATGEDAPVERIGRAEVRFVPFQRDPKMVARYYQAADVYIHAAKVDTFPNSVLEALACGTPVVATAVGGIVEQVKGLRITELGIYDADEATGVLVSLGSAEAMAEALVTLLTDEELHRRLRKNAAQDASRRFDLNREAEDYLMWYQEIVEDGIRGSSISASDPLIAHAAVPNTE